MLPGVRHQQGAGVGVIKGVVDRTASKNSITDSGEAVIKTPCTRYTCEFCGRNGYSAGHMKKHETGCTRNPDRICGMCKAGGLVQADPAAMRAILETGIESLKEMCKCPACILAAVLSIKVKDRPEYDYRTAHTEFWRTVNDEAAERESRLHYC